MLKKIWFQLHWFVGITAGTILIIIGVTGATLAFRAELLDLINPGVTKIAPRQEHKLTPQELITHIQPTEPQKRITAVTVFSEPGVSSMVTFAPPPGVRRGESRYFNPYNGTLLPRLSGQDFFAWVERLHRWLLLPTNIGKTVAGTLSACLFLLALSGLYLRWPRRPLSLRAWFKLDFTLNGRSFLWNLHSVIGTCALLMYLISTTTGMFWALDWFKQGAIFLAGANSPAQRTAPAPRSPSPQHEHHHEDEAVENESPISLDITWDTFLRNTEKWKIASLRLAENPKQPIQITYINIDAPHDHARNRMTINPRNGKILLNEKFSEQSAGTRFLGAVYPLHMGTYFGLPGRIIMLLATLALPLFSITGWMLYLDRRKKKKAVRAERALLARNYPLPSGSTISSHTSEEVLLAFATQSGQAERIALHTAGALQQAGMRTSILSLAQLDIERLRHHQRVLFIVSTFGEGEPPDAARRFAHQMKQHQADQLPHLHYGVLALGNRQYNNFCGFGLTLDHWLQNQGAQSLFPMIEVDDNHAAEALQRWEKTLSMLTGGATVAIPTTDTAVGSIVATYDQWILQQRHLLNPGSQGTEIYHIELVPPTGKENALHWRSGALIEMLPRNPPERVTMLLQEWQLHGDTEVLHQNIPRSLADALSRSILPLPDAFSPQSQAQAIADSLQPLMSRRYSIASIPEDRSIHLLVRQMSGEHGLGLASGWLTKYAAEGSSIELRLLDNDGFSLLDSDAPAIFIGNGSGMAGLRSHLRTRVMLQQRRNWLLFGERNREHDFHYQHEIEQWQRDGFLSRVDLAFSRDQSERIYVQDKIREAHNELRHWIHEGAVIYICGSLAGMAAGVDAALTDILGEAALHDLIARGHYRRDVY